MFISRETYIELLSDSYKLDALECAGVDNWSFYGYALKDYLKETNHELNINCKNFKELATYLIDNDKYHG